jgi:hypothetical protein
MARPAGRNLHFGPNFARLWIFMELVKFRQTGKKRNRRRVTLSQTARSVMYHDISRVQWLQCASCGFCDVPQSLHCASPFFGITKYNHISVRADIKTFIIGRTRYCKISRNKIARKQTSRRAGCFFPFASLSRATSCACEPVVQINGKKFSSGLYVQRSILDSLKCRPQVNLYPLRSPLLAYLVLHLRVGTQPKPRANFLETCVPLQSQKRRNTRGAPSVAKLNAPQSHHTETERAILLKCSEWFLIRAKHKGKEAHGCSQQCRRARDDKRIAHMQNIFVVAKSLNGDTVSKMRCTFQCSQCASYIFALLALLASRLIDRSLFIIANAF